MVPLPTGEGNPPLLDSKFFPAIVPSEDKVSGLYVGEDLFVDVLFASVEVVVLTLAFSFSFLRCSSLRASAKIAD